MILWGESRTAEKAQAAECPSPARFRPKAGQKYEEPDSSHPIVFLGNLLDPMEEKDTMKKII